MPAIGKITDITVGDLTARKAWRIYPSQEKPIIPDGNSIYVSVEVFNTGNASAYLFFKLTDTDTGKVLYSYTSSFPIDPARTASSNYYGTMPNKNLNLRVESGHDGIVDDSRTFTIFVSEGIPPPTVEYILTITAAVGGTTNPAPGQYKYAEGSMASVTAIPQQDYVFDHWNLDGVNVGAYNPISVTMNTNHTLEAVFVYSPPPPPGPPPVAPPVAPPPEEVPPTVIPPIEIPRVEMPPVEIISAIPAPTIIPPAPEAPPLPIAPETAGIIVLGAVTVIIIIGVAVWYFTKPS